MNAMSSPGVAGSTALAAEGLVKHFNGIIATDNVSLTLPRGARHALIGPNGAGKTTLINLLTGVLKPSAGRILLAGEDVTNASAQQRVQRGLARTFQINQLYGELTPLEALVMAIMQRRGNLMRWWQPVTRQKEACDEAVALLERLGLGSVMAERTSTLAYGKRRLLEVALALACQPQVLLLDEPAAGVPHGERDEILETIGALPRDVTLVLIEHDMEMVFRFAERISVLVSGALAMEGTPEEVAASPLVREVYLGGAHAVATAAHARKGA